MSSNLYSAVRWNAASTMLRYTANFIQIIIIARILGPEKFATVSIVLVIVTTVRPLLDLGSGIAVIHFQKLSHVEISTIYWLNLILSSLLAILALGLFPIVDHLYPSSALSFELFVLIAVHLFCFGSGQLYSALAEKKLRFKRLAVIEIVSALAGVVSAIYYLEYVSKTALVIGVALVCSSFIRSLLLHFFLSAQASFYPALKLSVAKKFLNFGATSTIANSVNTVYANADLFLGARFLSATTFGLYSLPRDIGLKFANAIINPIITRIALPVIASSQDNLSVARRAYHLTVLLTCSISFPVYLLLILFADDFIRLLLNDDWSSSSELLRLIAVWGLIRAAYNPIGYLCFAFGKPEKLLHWHLLMFAPTFVILLAALNYGVEGLVIGNIALAAASLVLSWLFIAKPIIDSSINDLLNCFLRPMTSGSIALLVAFATLTFANIDHYLLDLSTALLSFLLTYLLFSKLINQTFFNALLELFVIKTSSVKP